jgi:hypothetical protein
VKIASERELKYRQARMAELADARVLGARALKACGFKSHSSHQHKVKSSTEQTHKTTSLAI